MFRSSGTGWFYFISINGLKSVAIKCFVPLELDVLFRIYQRIEIRCYNMGRSSGTRLF